MSSLVLYLAIVLHTRLTNNILSTGQQVYLRQLGGAKAIVDKDGGDIISAGQAKRTPLPPSSSATASSTITTEAISAEDSRGQRWATRNLYTPDKLFARFLSSMYDVGGMQMRSSRTVLQSFLDCFCDLSQRPRRQ